MNDHPSRLARHRVPSRSHRGTITCPEGKETISIAIGDDARHTRGGRWIVLPDIAGIVAIGRIGLIRGRDVIGLMVRPISGLLMPRRIGILDLAWRALVLGIVLGCFVPYLSPRVIPIHDSGLKHASYYHFYTTWLTRGELARWVPYGYYGVDAAYFQWHGMTPLDYVIAAIGSLFGVSDTLLLFKLGILAQLIVFAGGLLMLTDRLFTTFAARFFVVIGGVLSVSWLVQPYLNFTLFYAVPMVLCLMLRFAERPGPAALWGALLMIAVTEIGDAPYGVSLHLLMFSVFALAVGRRTHIGVIGRALMTMWREPRAALCIVVVGVFAVFFIDLLRGTVAVPVGRDPHTYFVPLDVFRTYGRNSLGTTVFGTLTGGIVHSDNTYYVGLLPLVLFAYAVVHVHHVVFAALAVIVFGLWWLSVGGFFTTVVYFFPGMAFFRHIGLIFGVANLLVLAAAGFGLQHLIERLRSHSATPLSRRRVLLLAAVVAVAAVDAAYSWQKTDITVYLEQSPVWASVFAFRVAMYLVVATAALTVLVSFTDDDPRRNVWLIGLLLVGHMVDVASFQQHVLSTVPRVRRSVSSAEIYRVTPPNYIAERVDQAPDGRTRTVVNVLSRPTSYRNANYDIAYSLARLDLCVPRYRILVLAAPVLEMIEARGGRVAPYPGADFIRPDDDGFRRSLACELSKFWLAQQLIETRSGPPPFGQIVDPRRNVLLGLESGDEAHRGVELGHANVMQFSPNEVEIEIRSPAAGHIVYADAFHRGWRAWVDDSERPLVRANIGFKAVPIDAGQHIVRFRYKPGLAAFPSIGLAIIGLVAGLCLIATSLAAFVRPLLRRASMRRHEHAPDGKRP